MKRCALFVAICLLCGFASVAVAQSATQPSTTPNPAYPVEVHVTASSVKYQCGAVSRGTSSCRYVSELQSTIAGHSYQLQAETLTFHMLALGTYPAHEITDKARTYEVNRSYELLFPDHSTRKYQVTGMEQ